MPTLIQQDPNDGQNAHIITPDGTTNIPVTSLTAFVFEGVKSGNIPLPANVAHVISAHHGRATEAMAPQKRFQSCSIDVPGNCPNACKYCVSAMHTENLGEVTAGSRIQDEFISGFRDALVYVRSEGTDTLIFTGSDADPMANIRFLEHLCELNQELRAHRFTKLEIQTSGILMTHENITKIKAMGVKTIALSLSSINDAKNAEISGIRKNIQFQILDVCQRIKRAGINLRLCFNLTDEYHGILDTLGIPGFLKVCKDHGADQLTFREMYKSGHGPIDTWIDEHLFDPKRLTEIKQYVRDNGAPLAVLPFGATLYSIEGMSVVIDEDSMNAKGMTSTSKFAVLRPNGKLYSRWNDTGSLIM